MVEFGQSLRQLRSALGVSPESVSAATKVPVRHIISLETEEFQALPSNATARGFIRLLARYYQTDERSLIRLYDERVAPPPAVAPPAAESKTHATVFKLQPSGARNSWSVVVAAGVAGLLLFGWFHGSSMRVATSPAEQSQVAVNKPAARPAHPAVSQPKVAPPVVAPAEKEPAPPVAITQSVSPAAERPAESAASTPAELRLEMQASGQSWVQATVDGHDQREALLQPGERLLWSAADGMEMTIGNAGGLSLTFNGEAVASLGDAGQVVRLRVTKDGVEKIQRSTRPARRPDAPATTLAF